MKILTSILLVLLINISLVAQDSIFDSIHPPYDVEYTPYGYAVPDPFIPAIVKLLIEYDEHCKSDSIRVDLGDVSVRGSFDKLELDKELQRRLSLYDSVYIKRNNIGYYELFINVSFYRYKTPTFEDFLWWVKEKYAY